MNKVIFFSVIMPTYNSEKTIEKALASIRSQKFDQEAIEILVIDGGSTDRTIDIAKKYGADIIFNKERVPEAAKRLGYQQAKGKWIIKQDSDEVYTNNMQLARKKEFIDSHPNVYCLLSDRLLPGKRCGISCAYLNYCGDPFSYIVYDLRGSIVSENERYLWKQDSNGNVYRYKKGDQYPIGDGGCTAFNIEKFRELFGEEYDSQEYVNLSTQKLLESTGLMGCIPEDNIVHYSMSEFKTYLKKLRFRVYTNLNNVKQSGYSAKSRNNKELNRRKYLFVLYVISVIAPIIDSVKLCIQYKRIDMLLHLIYTYYVAFELAIGIVKKALGLQERETTYGR